MIPIENFFSQGELFRILHRQLQTGRVNHAILITGEAGLGKWTLANTVAAGLLCEASGEQDKPCGVCKSCIEMESLSHPDLIVIQKGKPLGQSESKSVIPVDDIREMIQIISRKSFPFTVTATTIPFS